jgi:integrase
MADGQRLSETYPTLELAEQAIAARRTDAARRKLGFANDAAVPFFRELAERYVEHHVKGNGRTNVAAWERKTRFRLDNLISFFGEYRLTTIRPTTVESYRKQQIASDRTFDAVRREIVLLKAVLNKAVHWQMIAENPVASLKCSAPIGEKRPEILSEEEIQAILSRLTGDRAKYRPLWTLALATGLRRNELLTLRWTDMDFHSRTVTVQAENAKARKARTIPLNQAALEALFSIRNNQSEKVFGHLPGLEGIVSTIRRIFHEAGIKKQGGGMFHLCRHTFATRLLQAGTDIRTVQALLGHSDLKMTLIYLHTSDSLKRQAVEKLSAFAASM